MNSRVWLLVTPWTIAYQAPPSMGFSRQEYWSGVPLPSPMTLWGFLYSPVFVSLRKTLKICPFQLSATNQLYHANCGWCHIWSLQFYLCQVVWDQNTNSNYPQLNPFSSLLLHDRILSASLPSASFLVPASFILPQQEYHEHWFKPILYPNRPPAFLPLVHFPLMFPTALFWQ